MTRRADIVVAGHICLDVIPSFPETAGAAHLLRPGSLTRVGPADCSTGGAVANVGLALHRLGVPVRLLGKVGDDMFGRQILECVEAAGAGLGDTLRRVAGETTSYTVVVNPPGSDRFFLHCPGANDTFVSADVDENLLTGARILHFGYPPIMREIYRNNGRELAAIFERARRRGLATSMDMASIDPTSEAGALDWRAFLASVLPLTDIFLPSVEELLFMLDRPTWQKLMNAGGAVKQIVNQNMLRALADELIRMGAAVVVIKLGDQGLYLRTTADAGRLKQCPVLKADQLDAWRDRELIAPCFQVSVAGTTGSGDCTIAGFLAALLRGESPEESATAAVAVGACSVEKRDAVSGVPQWTDVWRRISAGWARYACGI